MIGKEFEIINLDRSWQLAADSDAEAVVWAEGLLPYAGNTVGLQPREQQGDPADLLAHEKAFHEMVRSSWLASCPVNSDAACCWALAAKVGMESSGGNTRGPSHHAERRR